MTWNKSKVSSWLFHTGMILIKDGLFAEGGELIYESKYGDAANTRDEFVSAIKSICSWSQDEIDETILKIHLD